MAFNGAGVRDTARTLKIGINTVIRTLKNSTPTPKRSVEIHEKVIGTFIEKHMLY
ncbi:Transposase [Shigella dysenteriae 1617]|uniref:Transposase n=1 Tax=Shigella dysenteriae 1617 TaxID=754093 RepID=A0A0A6ZZG2_SHIDY|nr:Transposase [Shigella dysenteriae 1617]AHA64944.1 Transposase [Shigella dysenteriae 1617]AHA67503.1 Transposase [Shigella dysenteriae 1617]AHA67879.1 Transposase [Shigella dysenteriae 1617]AHA68853.1 Transposase [Shigella dysenteriae 1617]